MKKIITEFKEFAMKGNVLDLAVGVIMGGAFGKIISSLVNDVIMPLIANIFSIPDFTNLKFALVDKGEATPYVMYGSFIQNLIDFLIIAICIFLMVKALSTFNKKEEVVEDVAEPIVSDEVKLLTEIVEILKKK